MESFSISKSLDLIDLKTFSCFDELCNFCLELVSLPTTFSCNITCSFDSDNKSFKTLFSVCYVKKSNEE